MMIMDDSPIDQYGYGLGLPHHHPHYSPQPPLQAPSYFDFDLMKRQHQESSGGADAATSNKKPRFTGSPGSLLTPSTLATSTSTSSSGPSAAPDRWQNYGYGPSAAHHQAANHQQILNFNMQHQAQQHQQQQQQIHAMQQQHAQQMAQVQAQHHQAHQQAQQQAQQAQQAAQQQAQAQHLGVSSLSPASAGTSLSAPQSINGTYTAPASPFVPTNAGNPGNPSPTSQGFNFNVMSLGGIGMPGIMPAGPMSLTGMGSVGMNGMSPLLNGMGGMQAQGMLGMGMNGMGMGVNGMNMYASPFYGVGMGRGMPGQQLYGQNTAQVAALAAESARAAAAHNATGRTVYVGSLPSTATIDELLSIVRFGPLESVRLLPEKNCVFLSFLDGATAAAFHADSTVKKMSLHGQELKIGWGKASQVPAAVMAAVQQSNASRNVYLGGLDAHMTEDSLRADLSHFGPIDQVKIVKDKNIGFVHFLSISTATKVVAQLPNDPQWAGKRVNYGKDRCAYVPRSQQNANAGAAQMAHPIVAPQTVAAAAAMGQNIPFNPAAVVQSPTVSMMSGAPTPGMPNSPFGMGGLDPSVTGIAGGLITQQMPGNRTVYLGNIHPDTTVEDICNAVRGGIVQAVRYMKDKHICFVTFMDAPSAFAFFNVATFQGLTINNRRLKIGWGKASAPVPPALSVAVQAGATRNVYIGNIDNFELFSEERLRRDFGEFGEIELVNFLKEKNCAFVNFTNIANALKAIDAIKLKPEYSHLRVSHGKDRCANPPRAGVQGGGGRRGQSGGPTTAGAAGTATTGEGDAAQEEEQEQEQDVDIEEIEYDDFSAPMHLEGEEEGEDDAADAREAEHDAVADEAGVKSEPED